MNSLNLSVLNWNVRGLNCPNRRATVNATIATSACHLACLQESKLQAVDAIVAVDHVDDVVDVVDKYYIFDYDDDKV